MSKRAITNPEYREARYELVFVDRDGKAVDVDLWPFRYRRPEDYDPSDPHKNTIPPLIEVEDDS